jgi:hypothetical protein
MGVTFETLIACAMAASGVMAGGVRPTVAAKDRVVTSAVPRRARDADGLRLPAICRKPAGPLDRAGRRALAELERALIERALSGRPTVREDGWLNASEINRLLRKYPETEMTFLLPLPVAIPRSRFRVSTGASLEEVERADHTVFYLEVSDARMVRSGGEIGLLFSYGGGPAGTPPEGVGWMWGVWGPFCAVRDADGVWSAHATGPVAISEL